MKCRVCKSSIIPCFSLGKMPLVNSFLRKKDIKREKKYDLSIGFCPGCYLVQLLHTVSPELLFKDYIYFSSNSKTFLLHCKNIATSLISKLNLNSSSLVLEIASNDGAQLQYFKEKGIPILGIDPAENIAKVANERGIPTVSEFFNYSFAKKYLKNGGKKADLVFGANILAHVPRIVDLVKGIAAVLHEKGTAVFEFPYVKGLLENKFDTIYHEHVFYYSLHALKNLFKTANLEIYDVNFTHVQGGSLQIYICHKGLYKPSQNIINLEKKEKKNNYTKLATFKKIKNNVSRIKKEITLYLQKLKAEDKTIAAYSAPAKGNILLNYLELKKYIQFIVDKSPAKQGLYTPGTHLLVYSPEKIMQENPDYVLILCWNIADEVIKQLDKYKKKGGKFIIPLPHLQIV